MTKKCVNCGKEIKGLDYWFGDGKHCKDCKKPDINYKTKTIILIISLIIISSNITMVAKGFGEPSMERTMNVTIYLILGTLITYWIIKFIYKLIFFKEKESKKKENKKK